MSDNEDDPDKESTMQRQLAVAGVFLGLGFEVGAAVFLGYYGGELLDDQFGTSNTWSIVGTFVCLLAVFVHFFYVTKALHGDND